MKNHALSQYIINICCLKGVAPQHYQDIINLLFFFLLNKSTNIRELKGNFWKGCVTLLAYLEKLRCYSLQQQLSADIRPFPIYLIKKEIKMVSSLFKSCNICTILRSI